MNKDKDVNRIDVDNQHPRKWLLVLLVIFSIIIVVVLLSKIITDRENNKKNVFNLFDFIKEKVDTPSEFDIHSFNGVIEMYSGREYGNQVVYLLDKVTTSNKKNQAQLITVTYNDITTNDESLIRELKNKFDSWTKYDVSLDYDDKGFIDHVTIYD